jgi:chemotaxis protein histidine kinase CheA
MTPIPGPDGGSPAGGATILGDGTVSFILDVQGLAALGGLTTTTEARAA